MMLMMSMQRRGFLSERPCVFDDPPPPPKPEEVLYVEVPNAGEALSFYKAAFGGEEYTISDEDTNYEHIPYTVKLNLMKGPHRIFIHEIPDMTIVDGIRRFYRIHVDDAIKALKRARSAGALQEVPGTTCVKCPYGVSWHLYSPRPEPKPELEEEEPLTFLEHVPKFCNHWLHKLENFYRGMDYVRQRALAKWAQLQRKRKWAQLQRAAAERCKARADTSTDNDRRTSTSNVNNSTCSCNMHTNNYEKTVVVCRVDDDGPSISSSCKKTTISVDIPPLFVKEAVTFYNEKFDQIHNMDDYPPFTLQLGLELDKNQIEYCQTTRVRARSMMLTLKK